MAPGESERRRAVRRAPQSDEALSRVRLRTGRELLVVDISTIGALVESHTRLLPGTHTDVHVMTRHGRVLVRTRVIRAHIWRLERDIVCYRAALAFETAVDTDAGPALSESNGYAVPAAIPGNDEGRGIGYPNDNVGGRS